MYKIWNYMCEQVMDLGIIFIGLWQMLVRCICYPIFAWIERTPFERIPTNQEVLLRISAKKLAEKIRKRELKSEILIRAYIKRISEVNPVLNAIVEDRFDKAIEEAIAIDKRILEEKLSPEQIEKEWPLFGVPVTIKESCGLQGLSLCVGIKSRIGEKCPEDGEVVALLKAAGAIPLLVSTTPELCMAWETNNLVTGCTRNPYNTHRTSGGSSGGEGALIGAGASLIGIGSDVAGSIRIPSHFNGIFGHKPTGGIVSVKGHFPSSTDKEFGFYTVIGPMTRYAEDLRLMMQTISGENRKKLQLNTKVDMNTLTVYFMEELSDKLYEIPVQREIKNSIRTTVKYLGTNCGAEINRTKFLELHDALEMSISIFFTDFKDIPNILQNPKNPKENLNVYLETIKTILGYTDHSINLMYFYFLKETNAFIPKSKAAMFKEKFNQTKIKMEKTLGKNGIFLFPTFPTSAFNHYGTFGMLTGIAYTMIFNLMGFPSTHIPLGIDTEGLPYGFQIIAAPYQDHLCLSVAEKLEGAIAGWRPPPSKFESNFN